jgi:multicomponent K+:H+ antiporter subunit A
LLLMVFWEMTSISSFLLIGFWSHRQDAREGARMALVVTVGGGLALLGGVLLIGRIVGSFELDAVLAAGDLIRASSLYPYALFLVLAGIFTKSAQFPFHFWLPHAMAAPTPVSAYLHSATMVKAGVFLLARLHPALAGTDLFFYTVSGIGAITLLIGAWNAIFQHDLKGLLAYSTISHLGLITMLFGLSTPMAVVAGVFHILNHATFKASLFMAAGIIDHETGTRDMRKLGGLRRLMPITSAGDHRLAGDGRYSAAQRLPVQGNAVRRSADRGRSGNHARGDVDRRTAGRRVRRGLQPALRARHLLRQRPA